MRVAVDAVYCSDWGRIVAALMRLVQAFDVMTQAAQEACAAAVERWPVSGVPTDQDCTEGAAGGHHPGRQCPTKRWQWSPSRQP